MPDLIDELRGLHRGDLPEVSDAVVAEDVARGRRALRRRRARRGAATVLSGGLVAVVAGLAFGLGSDTGRGTPPATADGTVSTRLTPTRAVDLVAWHGGQLPGYTVAYVPEGFVLQGVSDSVLDIARPGDTSPLDAFVGKLVVMLSDQPTTPAPDAAALVVTGRAGWLTMSDDATVLSYDDGAHHVIVQAWNDLGLDRRQLVQFAEGVTVTAEAVPGHG